MSEIKETEVAATAEQTAPEATAAPETAAATEAPAERAKNAGVEAVVFDRGGNKYAGRVAAIADGAREAGLNL